MVTTANKLYEFKGSASEDKHALQQIFKTYLSIPEKFETAPCGLSFKSKLEFYYNNIKDAPIRFAWLTGAGIFYGNVC